MSTILLSCQARQVVYIGTINWLLYNRSAGNIIQDCLNAQALLPLFPELLLQLPSRVFTATSLLILAYLGPAMWYLWMDLGTGNANFFYAITLFWAAWQVTLRL